MTENGKVGRPQKYLFQKDWDAFISKEWNPFKYNEWHSLKRDVAWIKYLLGGMILALIAAAIAVLSNT